MSKIVLRIDLIFAFLILVSGILINPLLLTPLIIPISIAIKKPLKITYIALIIIVIITYSTRIFGADFLSSGGGDDLPEYFRRFLLIYFGLID